MCEKSIAVMTEQRTEGSHSPRSIVEYCVTLIKGSQVFHVASRHRERSDADTEAMKWADFTDLPIVTAHKRQRVETWIEIDKPRGGRV